MWFGPRVHLSRLNPHDLQEAAGDAHLGIRPLPQLPDPAGHSQHAGSVLHVEKQSDTNPEPPKARLKDVIEISNGNL